MNWEEIPCWLKHGIAPMVVAFAILLIIQSHSDQHWIPITGFLAYIGISLVLFGIGPLLTRKEINDNELSTKESMKTLQVLILSFIILTYLGYLIWTKWM